MRTILSMIREPRQLKACVLIVTPLDVGQDDLPQALQAVDYNGVASIELCTLDECGIFLNPRQKQLIQSWEALRTAKFPHAEILFHILVVLSETIVGDYDRVPLPSLTFGQDAMEPARRPTAAHPRAFKGTKYQPPKSREADTVNLCPYLCDEQSVSLLRTRLRAFWPDAIARLSIAGYRIPTDCSLHFAALTAIGSTADLPLPFQAALLSQLRGQEKAVVNQCLVLYWKLEMDANPDLLAAFARLLTLQTLSSQEYSLPNILQWGEFVTLQPPEHRAVFMTMLAETEAVQVDPFTLTPSITQEFSELYAQPFWKYRLYSLLRALRLGLDGEYFIAGFTLANEFDEDYLFHAVTQCGAVPAEPTERLIRQMRQADKYFNPMRLWQLCGEFPAFTPLLTAVDWAKYAPDAAEAFLNFSLSVLWQDWPQEKKRKAWRFISHNVPAIERLLASISSDYHLKCLNLLQSCLCDWDAGAMTQQFADFGFAVLKRLCAPPFRTKPFDDRILPDCARSLNEEQRQIFLDSPQSSFLRLEESCVRIGSGNLVQAGLYSLFRLAPGWTVQCFRSYPAKLCKVARLLGCFSDGLRDSVMRDFARDTLAIQNIADLDLMAAFQLISERHPEHVNPENPEPSKSNRIIPRQIREHLANKKILDATRLTFYRAEMEKRLLLAQLEILETASLQAMYTGFGSDMTIDPDDNIFHAMQIRCDITHNRRCFHKFLRAYLSGNKDYILQHPRSQLWLKRHFRIDPTVWCEGIKFPVRQLEGHGSVQLLVETEPLEALKMGTYVGSCLGVGGVMAHSAIANMLDVNKQAIYARDSTGKVLARQLVAISDDDQLVCFEVYPYELAASIKKLFLDYDILFAHSLGIIRYDENAKSNSEADTEVDSEAETGYKIQNVLSQYWWDDGAWDFNIDAENEKKESKQYEFEGESRTDYGWRDGIGKGNSASACQGGNESWHWVFAL